MTLIAGSGTTLVEAKLKGINSIGTDLNPLARLLSKTKSSVYDLALLRQARAFFITKLFPLKSIELFMGIIHDLFLKIPKVNFRLLFN